MPDIKRKTTIGGQALIEGIIIRGPEQSCIVVRRADGGLTVRETPATKAARHKILKLPFIRGAFNLIDSMREGISAINYSASLIETDEEESRFEKWLNRKFGAKAAESWMMTAALVLGCALPVGLFILLPTVLAGLLPESLGTGMGRNLFEGLIRILIFLTFLTLVSRQSDIRRTFMYHGAEHKTIFCYEMQLPLTVENARAQTRFHPRCGTSFLFVVMILSILLFSFFSWGGVVTRVLLRLALLPALVGISYEINRFVGRYDNPFTRALRAPGLALQRLTTAEPDDSMLEVAIEALVRVIPEEKGADAW